MNAVKYDSLQACMNAVPLNCPWNCGVLRQALVQFVGGVANVTRRIEGRRNDRTGRAPFSSLPLCPAATRQRVSSGQLECLN